MSFYKKTPFLEFIETPAHKSQLLTETCDLEAKLGLVWDQH